MVIRRTRDVQKRKEQLKFRKKEWINRVRKESYKHRKFIDLNYRVPVIKKLRQKVLKRLQFLIGKRDDWPWAIQDALKSNKVPNFKQRFGIVCALWQNGVNKYLPEMFSHLWGDKMSGPQYLHVENISNLLNSRAHEYTQWEVNMQKSKYIKN